MKATDKIRAALRELEGAEKDLQIKASNLRLYEIDQKFYQEMANLVSGLRSDLQAIALVLGDV